MITFRPAGERGRTQFDWLDSWHSFSFGGYYDPEHTGFGPLRVINDDVIAPGGGFSTHGHRDMEIITHVLSGALEHKDSLGTGSVIAAGDVQKMSAGKGILHSEFNVSDRHPVHLLQIWIEPDTKSIPPSYQQITPQWQGASGWKLVASQDGRDGSIWVKRDVTLSIAKPKAGEKLAYSIPAGRRVWLHVGAGEAKLDGHALKQGDAVALENESSLNVEAVKDDTTLLLFDLP
ncbi:MAG: pirin family protein [Alphaproteobacteria bacterium]|nr:pirin family protein [Alphaproteobacteria bacterium]